MKFMDLPGQWAPLMPTIMEEAIKGTMIILSALRNRVPSHATFVIAGPNIQPVTPPAIIATRIR